MDLLTTVAYNSTWFSIVSDLHNHTNASRRPQRAMQTVLRKRPLTTYNLYREHNCCTIHITKATDVFPSHDCIFHVERVPTDDIFYSLLAALICCYRGRHRCDTVIHACLQPTRDLSFKADLNFCVRSSGARPQHIAKDCCCG